MVLLAWGAGGLGAEPCPPPNQRNFPNGLQLSGSQSCTLTGAIQVTGGIQLSDRAHLTLEGCTLTLRGVPPGQANIRLQGGSQLTVRGMSSTPSLPPGSLGWQKHPNNPVYRPEQDRSWNPQEFEEPTVVKLAGVYHLWYEGDEEELGGWNRIAYATSTNGVDWIPYARNPVFGPGRSGEWDDAQVSEPSVLVHPVTGEFWMYYAGLNRQDADEGRDRKRIGVAFSRDGKEWRRYPGNPVLRPGTPTQWDQGSVLSAHVLYDPDDRLFKMWYSGIGVPDESALVEVGYATSPDGLRWTKWPQNPLLRVGPPGAWDDAQVCCVAVLKDQGILRMWYSGMGAGAEGINTGYAQWDGNRWVKFSDNPVFRIGRPNEWDGAFAEVPWVLREGNTFQMWYDGGREERPNELMASKIGYATNVVSPPAPTELRLENTSGVLLDAQEPQSTPGPFVRVEGTVKLQGILKLGRRATLEIVRSTTTRVPYLMAAPGGDTQLVEDARLVITSSTVQPTEEVAHDTIAIGSTTIVVTNSNYLDGMISVSEEATLLMQGPNPSLSRLEQLQIGDQAQAEVINTAIGDMMPVLDSGPWPDFVNPNPEDYLYDGRPARFRLRLQGCQVSNGWVFYITTGTQVRLERVRIGLALTLHDVRARLGRLRIGFLGQGRDEQLAELVPLGISVVVHDVEHTGYNVYISGQSDVALSSDGLFETEAYDQSVIRISSTTLYPIYLSAEGQGQIEVDRSRLLSTVDDQPAQIRCRDRGKIRILNSSITMTGIAVEGSSRGDPARIELINSPLPVYLRAVGHSDVWLTASGRRDQIRELTQESPARITVSPWGDLNRDERVTQADADLAAQMVVGSRPPMRQADLNGDGRVNALDLQRIINEARPRSP